jgi:ubiquinone/menaquinone biosynthesis C-methylase UbiE
MNHNGNQMVDPNLLFEKAQIQPGMHVADFGCGKTGHIVFPAAHILGEHGIMYAVDIMKPDLEIVNKRADLNNALNVQTIWADLERVGMTAIPKNSIDIGFIVNTLVQSKKQEDFLTEVARLLKDKARLVVVDWAKKGLTFGPKDEHFIDFENIKKLASSHGFVLQEEFPVGKFHHGLVFYKHA